MPKTIRRPTTKAEIATPVPVKRRGRPTNAEKAAAAEAEAAAAEREREHQKAVEHVQRQQLIGWGVLPDPDGVNAEAVHGRTVQNLTPLVPYLEETVRALADRLADLEVEHEKLYARLRAQDGALYKAQLLLHKLSEEYELEPAWLAAVNYVVRLSS